MPYENGKTLNIKYRPIFFEFSTRNVQFLFLASREIACGRYIFDTIVSFFLYENVC